VPELISGPRLLSKLGALCSFSFSTLAVKLGWLPELLLEDVLELLPELLLPELALRSFQGMAITLSPEPAELLESTANSTRPDCGFRMTSWIWPRFSPCWLFTFAPISLVAMKDCC